MSGPDVADSGVVPSREELARLRWRCRRGMRELDVLLTRYLERDYATALTREREAFAQLLDLQDPVVFGYLVGQQSPDQEDLRHVVARIRRQHA